MRGNRGHIGRVEDYTVPFLVSFYVLVLLGLCTIWAVSGYPMALFVCLITHVGLGRLIARRAGL